MRKITSIVLISILFISCKKDYQGDNFDFSDSLPPYVALSSTADKTVQQGTSTTVTFQMRSALEQEVTVYYDVKGGGVDLSNQTAVINVEKTTTVATITIPMVIVPPATEATATLQLVKAVAADGTMLTIGSKNEPTSQKVTINITL